MTHPDKERKLERFPDREPAPKGSSDELTFEQWMDLQLEKLEQKFKSFMTVNSARQHYGR